MTITKIKSLLEKSEMTESDLQHLLVLIRKELESLAKSDAEKYNDLKLFCDWTVHNRIDRSSAGSQLISVIHNTINQLKESNSDNVIQETSKSLLMPFKEQLKDFLQKRSLHTIIIDENQRWKHFLKVLFEVIESSHVVLQINNEKDLQEKPLKLDMWVKEISVIKSNLGNSQPEEIYCLQITANDTTVIIIPLTPS